MKQHRKMFQYVEEMLYSYDRRKGDKSKNKIEYDRYAHTCLLYTSVRTRRFRMRSRRS